jgi:uncharacterized protein YjbI with pentapeptide repeats
LGEADLRGANLSEAYLDGAQLESRVEFGTEIGIVDKEGN